MKTIGYILSFLACMLTPQWLHAQPKVFEYARKKCDSTGSDVTLYAGLIHQHQNFFKQAFSFQGIEAGISINHKFLVAAYGSTFVSTLAVPRANGSLFVFADQYGFLIGVEQANRRRFHLGGLLTMGYFSLVGNDTDFKVFKAKNPLIKVSGFVLSPQVYIDLTLTKWMKFRPGIGYSLYKFDEQPLVSKADLQSVAFTFGFIFGLTVL